MERYIKYTSIVYYIMLVIESAIALWLYIKRLFIKKFRINYKIPVGYTIERGSLAINASLPETIVITKSGNDVRRQLGKASALADMMISMDRVRAECHSVCGVSGMYEESSNQDNSYLTTEMNNRVNKYMQKLNYTNYALMMKAI